MDEGSGSAKPQDGVGEPALQKAVLTVKMGQGSEFGGAAEADDVVVGGGGFADGAAVAVEAAGTGASAEAAVGAGFVDAAEAVGGLVVVVENCGRVGVQPLGGPYPAHQR